MRGAKTVLAKPATSVSIGERSDMVRVPPPRERGERGRVQRGAHRGARASTHAEEEDREAGRGATPTTPTTPRQRAPGHDAAQDRAGRGADRPASPTAAEVTRASENAAVTLGVDQPVSRLMLGASTGKA